MAIPPSGTVTFLFSSVDRAAELWERHPSAMQAALHGHDQLVTEAMAESNGHVFKASGGSLCVAFDRALDAVGAARNAQRQLRGASWDEVGRLRVRIAIHTGVSQERDGDYFGSPLNRCARLRDAAHGGQTLVSSATTALVRTALPSDLTLLDLGEHRLRDLSEPERIYQLSASGIETVFPPILTLERRPHNLPVRATSFVGRAGEVEQLRQLITTDRLVTLTGAAGAGKSSLGLQAAADVASDFVDGVWLVELASISDPKLVEKAVATSLRVRDESHQTLLETLTSYLAGKQMLLVLDNCEHVIDMVAELVDRLLSRCAGVHVMCLSREALNVAGETIRPVRPLDVPEATAWMQPDEMRQVESVALFLDRVEAARPGYVLGDETASAVCGICRRLGGIPLALELAAARAKMLSLEEIETRLDDLFALLRGGSRTGLPWHKTMQAAIDWSYDLLPETERALFRRMSVFHGSCDMASVETVCGWDGVESSDVLDLIARLVDKSFIQVDRSHGVRYRLLLVLREYGLERLEASGESETTFGRHLALITAFAEEAEDGMIGQDQAAWLERLDLEHENVLGAMAWSLESGALDLGLRTGGALWRYWYVRGNLSEGREQLEALLDADGTSSRNESRRLALHGAGTLAGYQGDLDACRDLLGRSLAIADEMGDRAAAAKSLNNMALAAYVQGDYSAAQPLYERSLVIKRDVGDEVGIATSLNNLGLVALEMGDLDEAEVLLQESLAVQRRLGGQVAITETTVHFGTVKRIRGETASARVLLEEALAQQRALGDRNRQSETLRQMGSTAQYDGDFAAAHRHYEKSLEVALEIADTLNVAEARMHLGYLAIDEGDHEAARAYLDESLATFERIGSRRGIAHSENGLGRLECAEGKPDRARGHLTRGLRLAREMPHCLLTIESLECIACMAESLGEPERALTVAGAAHAQRLARSMPNAPHHEAKHAGNTDAARRAIGAGPADELWAAGSALSVEEATTYALQTTGGGQTDCGSQTAGGGQTGGGQTDGGQTGGGQTDGGSQTTDGRQFP